MAAPSSIPKIAEEQVIILDVPEKRGVRLAVHIQSACCALTLTAVDAMQVADELRFRALAMMADK